MQFDRVIVVDDDPVIRRILVAYFQKMSTPVLGVGSVRQAVEEHRKEPADLLVADLQLADGTGLDVLRGFKEIGHPCESIIMTAFGTIETAVDAMKMGAANYLLKPFTVAQFDVAMGQLLEQRKLRSENAYLKEQLRGEEDERIFRSPEMMKVDALITRVAPTDATVLIQGESGTGKEIVADTIHRRSLRRDRPYVRVNCAAVPGTLLESEFFGHEKGAFTGALSRRQGRFELASSGTLLLDEVTEIPLALQAKLLRVLQEREFERLGGSRTIKVDVRVLATTNRDLEHAVKSGQFREDLFFRLNVVPIQLPPLRERQEEVGEFVDVFVREFAQKHNKPVPTVETETMERLRASRWPGNVRELRNSCERAVIIAEQGRGLRFEDFAMSSPSSGQSSVLLDEEGRIPTIAEMEKRLIQLAMRACQGRRAKAAEMLGINVRTLRYKLKEYGQADGDDEDSSAEASGEE
jgi:DNA-binding NtrC family response regulator